MRQRREDEPDAIWHISYRVNWRVWHLEADHACEVFLDQCMRLLKRNVANILQGEMDISGHFWEGKHHRRRLVDPWAIVTAVAYDHRNPVRAGIVAMAEDYRRSSARWWAGEEDSPIATPHRSDPPFGVSPESIRRQVLLLQKEKRLDDVMEAFSKSLRARSTSWRRSWRASKGVRRSGSIFISSWRSSSPAGAKSESCFDGGCSASGGVKPTAPSPSVRPDNPPSSARARSSTAGGSPASRATWMP